MSCLLGVRVPRPLRRSPQPLLPAYTPSGSSSSVVGNDRLVPRRPPRGALGDSWARGGMGVVDGRTTDRTTRPLSSHRVRLPQLRSLPTGHESPTRGARLESGPRHRGWSVDEGGTLQPEQGDTPLRPISSPGLGPGPVEGLPKKGEGGREKNTQGPTRHSSCLLRDFSSAACPSDPLRGGGCRRRCRRRASPC